MDQLFGNNVISLCTKGYERYNREEYTEALRLFYQAWITLPEPRNHCDDAEIVLCAIGDSYFRMSKNKLAIEVLRSALDCKQTESRELVELRLGQCLLNSGQTIQAKTYLQRTYRRSGKRLFICEDNKYLDAISELI